MMRNRRLGRPAGPTENRGDRPWDPPSIKQRELMALLYVAANPDLPRWRIAQHLGISPSRLSIITCSPSGERYLKTLMARHPDRLRPYRLPA